MWNFLVYLAVYGVLFFGLPYGSIAHASDASSTPGIFIVNPQEEAPDFALPALSGEEIRLADFKDKVVLINFWATWCGPCRDEMPSMEQLWRRFKDRDFVILAISLDKGNKSQVNTFIRKLSLTYPVLLDPKEYASDRYKLFGLPTSYLIGRNGKITGKVAGPLDWASPKVAAVIEELLHDK
jgi:peroxiredoxin